MGAIINDTKIPADTFKGTGFKTVEFTSKKTEIEANAFENCTSLTSIHNSYTGDDGEFKIGDSAFKGCSSLTGRIEGVTSIGADAINGTNVTAVEMTSIDDFVQSNLNGTKSLIDFILTGEYVYIQQGVFSECTNLKSITINASSVEFGTGAFMGDGDVGCPNLESISINSTEAITIPSKMFGNQQNAALKSIRINANVNSLWGDAFENCGNKDTALEIEFCNPVQTTVPYDFVKGLGDYSRIIFDSTVNEIYYGAFSGNIGGNSSFEFRGTVGRLDRPAFNRQIDLNKGVETTFSSITQFEDYEGDGCQVFHAIFEGDNTINLSVSGELPHDIINDCIFKGKVLANIYASGDSLSVAPNCFQSDENLTVFFHLPKDKVNGAEDMESYAAGTSDTPGTTFRYLNEDIDLRNGDKYQALLSEMIGRKPIKDPETGDEIALSNVKSVAFVAGTSGEVIKLYAGNNYITTSYLLMKVTKAP